MVKENLEPKDDRFIDDIPFEVEEPGETKELNFPQCIVCEHLISAEKQTCEAFPKGIPDKFFFGDVMHDVSVEGDNGIIFEPIEEILVKEKWNACQM